MQGDNPYFWKVAITPDTTADKKNKPDKKILIAGGSCVLSCLLNINMINNTIETKAMIIARSFMTVIFKVCPKLIYH